MQMQQNETTGTQASGVPSLSPGGKKPRWLVTLGALVVVVLLVGTSAFVFAQLAGRQRNLGASIPPEGQWKQVLAGYTSIAIVAGQSNPGTLYACATKSNVVSSRQSPATFTLLRSSDFGDHWQDIGVKANLGATCDMAVNPANSDELYVVSTSSSGKAAALKHSVDGGQNWQSIQPALTLPNAQGVQWQVQQLSYAGNRLFAIQTVLASSARSTPAAPQAVWRSFSSRLVFSSDGGHTWTLLDKRSQVNPLGVRSYAVDPTDANTIYEELGPLALPIEPVPASVGQQSGAIPGPVSGSNGQLYKTSDGGASWSLLLKNLPYGTQVRLASGKPQVIYVGGITGPVPLAASPASSTPGSSFPSETGFHMQVSVDGGTTWKNVRDPSDALRVVSWFVSADGFLYSVPYIAASGGTAVPGTVMPATPIAPPPITPTGGPKYSGPPTKGTPDASSATIVLGGVVDATSFIQRYDPTTEQWSNVAEPPLSGMVLTVTSTSSSGGSVLWFMSQIGSQYSVYRYIV